MRKQRPCGLHPQCKSDKKRYHSSFGPLPESTVLSLSPLLRLSLSSSLHQLSPHKPTRPVAGCRLQVITDRLHYRKQLGRTNTRQRHGEQEETGVRRGSEEKASSQATQTRTERKRAEQREEKAKKSESVSQSSSYCTPPLVRVDRVDICACAKVTDILREEERKRLKHRGREREIDGEVRRERERERVSSCLVALTLRVQEGTE